MKIKTISRREVEETRDRKDDRRKSHRAPNAPKHFARATEVARATNAGKLQRMFAKPFEAQFEGHRDGVNCLAVHTKNLAYFASGDFAGVTSVWDLRSNALAWSSEDAAGFGHVRGVQFVDEISLLCCGLNEMRLYSAVVPGALANDVSQAYDAFASPGEFATFSHMDGVGSASIVTCGHNLVSVWDVANRREPTSTYSLRGVESIHRVSVNPATPHVVASCSSDRSITLYDTRQDTPLGRVVLQMKSNALSWNPREPLNFIVGNEDANSYAFDMRKLDRATMIHRDHVSAVMDVDFSPTGREFASASYDKSVRVFERDDPRSKEIYHTERMQRVFSVKYTKDSKHMLTGSDDFNVRLWKAKAWEKTNDVVSKTERRALEYRDALLTRYGQLDDVRRITRKRHVPKPIYLEASKNKIVEAARKRKAIRVQQNGGAKDTTKIKTKMVVKQIE